MTQLFSIELNDKSLLKDESNEVCLYTRGEAIKKARAFKGKIKPYGKKFTTNEMKMLQLSKSELHTVIALDLQGREDYVDSEDISEPIYSGEVFDAMLGEFTEHNKLYKKYKDDVIDELVVLSNICQYYDYIQLTD